MNILKKAPYLILFCLFLLGLSIANGQTCKQGVYTLNGNTNDISGNAFDGVLNGAVLTTDSVGNPNRAYLFDGVDDNIHFPVDFDYPERSVSLWFKANSASSAISNIYSSDHPGLSNGLTSIMVIETAGVNYVRFQVGGSASNQHNEPINLNTWYMATITVGPTETKYYLNCSLLGTFSNFTNTSTNGTSGSKLGCGRNFTNFFHGAIDMVNAYNCELTANDVCDLFNFINEPCLQGYYALDSNARDATINGLAGTIFGAIASDDRFGNPFSAFEFDGLDDFITLPSDFDFAERTVNIWFESSNLTPDNGMVFNIDHLGLNHGNIMFRPFEAGGVNVLRMNAGGGGAATQVEVPINEGQWYMASIAMNSDSIWYYLDCALVGSSPNQSNSSTNGMNSAIIGSDRDLAPYFEGRIDELSIYDCVLSSQQICELYAPSTTSISEFEVEFSIHPNPTKDYLIFTSKDWAKIDRIRLIDLQGNIIKEITELDYSLIQINLSEISAGCYSVQVSTESTSETVRIIKQ